jgi:hypothetical protein
LIEGDIPCAVASYEVNPFRFYELEVFLKSLNKLRPDSESSGLFAQVDMKMGGEVFDRNPEGFKVGMKLEMESVGFNRACEVSENLIISEGYKKVLRGLQVDSKVAIPKLYSFFIAREIVFRAAFKEYFLSLSYE